MHENKAQRLEESLNGAATKVLAVVPIGEPWNTTQIVAELARVGTRLDYRVIEGSLAKLADLGLIRQQPRGSYRRVPVTHREKPVMRNLTPVTTTPVIDPELAAAAAERPILTVPKAPAVEPPQIDTFGKLAAVAKQMRDAADLLGKAAASIEDIALEVEREKSANGAELTQLRQLRALLKGLV